MSSKQTKNIVGKFKHLLVVLFIFGSVIFSSCSTAETADQNITPTAETTPTIDKQTNGRFKRSLEHNGLKREYILYVPNSYTGEKPVPLVIVFHGYTAYANQMISYADFRPIADRAGFILVYPQGAIFEGATHWNVGGWTTRSTINDVGFVKAMLEALNAEYNIDLTRVYATGHSNGGYMSFRLACELSGKIAAIASVSGSMTPETFNNCDAEHPVPVLQIHGTADKVVAYNGEIWSMAIDEVLRYWVHYNDCETDPTITTVPHNPNTTSETSVEHIQYVGCDNGVTVEHYKYIAGGHEWLGTLDEVGNNNKDIDTNAEIWAFFSRYDINGFIQR